MFYLFECPSVIKKNKELPKSQRCILFSTLMRCICTLHDYLKKKTAWVGMVLQCHHDGNARLVKQGSGVRMLVH